MIDLKTLRALVKLMKDNDLTELDVEDQGEKVKLKRSSGAPEVHYVPGPAGHGPAPVANIAPQGGATRAPAEAGGGAGDKPAADEGTPIPSPMVGTFYSAPSPDAAPFVAVGDSVDEETVVCIVEAMKVFNEIKAETRGVVTRVLVENGQAVEFGQPLFMVKPN